MRWRSIGSELTPSTNPTTDLAKLDYPPQRTSSSSAYTMIFMIFRYRYWRTFPREAGRHPPEPRTLPFMPGPAEDVDDELTATRRVELDDYIHGLCNLAKTGQRYILEHRVVRTFLALKPGDVSSDGEPRTAEVEALLNNDSSDDWYATESQRVQEQLDRMGISDKNAPSDGSDYEDDKYVSPQTPQPKPYENHPYGNAGRYEDRLRSQALTTRDQSRRHLSTIPHRHAQTPLTAQWNGMPRLGQCAKVEVDNTTLINNTIRRPP
jgi:bud emergence protein 1